MRVLRQIANNQHIAFQTIPKITIEEYLEKKNVSENKNLFLIKVKYSPLNPSDFGFIGGVYGKKPYSKFPKALGFEGSGVIEETPENEKSLLGKKVAFCCNYEDDK